MNRADRRKLLSYIGTVREVLRMQNWDIVLHEDPCEDPEAHAETWSVPNHYVINIRVDPDLLELPPEGVRNTIIHELVHAQHRDVNLLWEGVTKENSDVPLSQATSWDKDYHMLIERFVSWISDRIEHAVPLWDPNAKVNLKSPGLYDAVRPS